MNRRDFIRLSLLGAGSIIAPQSLMANSATAVKHHYLTPQSPGRWPHDIDRHIPRIKPIKTAIDTRIQVFTPHPMRNFHHYISKHVLLNEKLAVIADRMFDPLKDRSASSQFLLGNYRGRIHVLSVCNRHGTWLNYIDI